MRRTSDTRAGLLVAAATVLLIAGALVAYAGWAVVDEDRFTERAGAALREPDVVEEIGLRLADRMTRGRPHAELAAPDVRRAAVAAAESNALAGPVTDGVRRMHRMLFRSGAPAELVPRGSREAVRQALGAREAAVPAGPDVALLTVGRGGRLERELRRAASVAPAVVAAAPLVIALGLLLLAVAIMLAGDRWRAFRAATVTLALATTAIGVGSRLALEVLLQTFTSRHGDAVVTAIWNAFLHDLQQGSLVVAAAATLAAIAGTAAMQARAPRASVSH